MEKVKNWYYRYRLIKDGRVVLSSFTDDLNRLEAIYQREYPGSRIKQVGGRVSRVKALRWERRQSGGWGFPALSSFISRILRRAKSVSDGIEVASIPTKNYKEVIEIRVPTRFYWNEDDSFDGIEFGPFKTDLLPWQEDMMTRCLEASMEKDETESP